MQTTNPTADHGSPAEAAQKTKTRPTGPVCRVCKTGRYGHPARTWKNKTAAGGKTYYRCSRCGGCWWPAIEFDPNTGEYFPGLGKKWPDQAE